MKDVDGRFNINFNGFLWLNLEYFIISFSHLVCILDSLYLPTSFPPAGIISDAIYSLEERCEIYTRQQRSYKSRRTFFATTIDKLGRTITTAYDSIDTPNYTLKNSYLAKIDGSIANTCSLFNRFEPNPRYRDHPCAIDWSSRRVFQRLHIHPRKSHHGAE